MKKFSYKKIVMTVLAVALLTIIAFFLFVYKSRPKSENILTLYIGGYGSSAQKFTFNPNSLELSKVGEFKFRNPSFLALSQDGSVLYAVSENGNKSAVGAFENSASFALLNDVWRVGAGPCYIVNYKNHLFSANYDDGSVDVLRLYANGAILKSEQRLKFTPSSKRNKSHIHTVRPIKGKYSQNDYLLITDKGDDKLYMYKILPDTSFVANGGTPERADLKLYKCDSSYLNLPSGYGPRHVEFSKDGKYCYLMCEDSGNLLTYTINEDNGNLVMKEKQNLVADIYGGKASADIHISPNGEYLYTSHRKGRDGISIFKIADDGTLMHAGYQLTSSYPRSFTISPDGKFMFVACQKAKEVQIFTINSKSGFLSNTGKSISFTDLEPSVILIK